jgi:hypothetical protein
MKEIKFFLEFYFGLKTKNPPNFSGGFLAFYKLSFLSTFFKSYSSFL